MISAGHLLWIVPLSMAVGAFAMGLVASKRVIAAQRAYDNLVMRYKHDK